MKGLKSLFDGANDLLARLWKPLIVSLVTYTNAKNLLLSPKWGSGEDLRCPKAMIWTHEISEWLWELQKEVRDG